MKRVKNRLLIFANDAASANVTAAYAYLYKKHFSQILAFANNTAFEIYAQYIPEYVSTEKTPFLTEDTVVTGTSGINARYEMEIIKKAKKANVKKIITILDNTLNFNMRFSLNGKLLEKKYFPDEIWLFEENFKSEIKALNQKFIYKKDIYIEFLEKLFKENPPRVNHSFIKKFKNRYLVILTEYVYELYGLRFGFTEYEILENILKSISESNLNIPVFLKLHPREKQNKYNIILRKYDHLDILKDQCNIQELIYYSKLILGINSSVFKEASLFKKKAYSIQIGSNSSLPLKFLTKKNIIYSTIQLKEILKKEFINE